MLPTNDWRARMLATTRGTQFGAVVACALGKNLDAIPRFEGRAVVTSDGFVQCDFVDTRRRRHSLALIGSIADLRQNISRLQSWVCVPDSDSAAYWSIFENWISTNYSGGALALRSSPNYGNDAEVPDAEAGTYDY